MNLFAWLHWNPDRVVFTIPYINHPIVWYGLFFVFGFIVGYFLMISLFEKKLKEINKTSNRETALFLVDRLTWFSIAGTIIGARLGHVFFYDWPRYQHNPIEIIQVWKGGLASHGGAIGVLIALFLYRNYINKLGYNFKFVTLLDMIVIPTAFVGFCIRMGNFFNQEILGVETTLPWGIIFEDPMERVSIVPRHPVQLYEALAYLLTFILLFFLFRTKTYLKEGLLSGLFFLLVFGSRFFIEFLKVPQSAMINESLVQTGQLLSIPFIILGCYLILKKESPNFES